MDKKQKIKELARKYYDRLFRSALFMCGDEAVAEELVQETFVGAVKSMDNFEGRSSYYTWLYAILRNKFRGWLRKKEKKSMSLERTAENIDGGGVDELLEDDRPDAAEELIHQEDIERVREVLDELPHHHRSVLVLRYMEGMSYEDIADTLGCSLGTVKSRIHYALKKVGKKMNS